MSKEDSPKATLKPEWSHNVEVEDIGETALLKKLSASPQERKDLARRMNVVHVDSLSAELKVAREDKGFLIHVTGRFKGVVAQECALSQELIKTQLEGDVEGWFAEEGRAISLSKVRHDKDSKKANAELEILSERDDPDPVIDGMIDLGELVTQHAILEIDPYIRAEGAVSDSVISAEEAEKKERKINNPFAALKNWKGQGAE